MKLFIMSVACAQPLSMRGGGERGKQLTRQLDNFASVQQGGRDRLQSVRRADKQDLAEIDRNIDIMILESGDD